MVDMDDLMKLALVHLLPMLVVCIMGEVSSRVTDHHDNDNHDHHDHHDNDNDIRTNSQHVLFALYREFIGTVNLPET